MITKLSSFTYCVLVGMLLAMVAEAAPITLSDAYYFRRRVADPWSDNPQVLIGVTVEPVAGTTVTATSLVDNSYQFPLTTSDPCFPNQFLTIIPSQWNPDPRLLSGFKITAVNGADTKEFTTHDILGTKPMPFVSSSISASNFLTPTISWIVPPEAASATNIRVRRWTIPYGDCKNFDPLPIDATSFTFPNGALEPNQEYSLHVLLAEVRNGNLVNRSEQRLPYSTAGPICKFPAHFRDYSGLVDFPDSSVPGDTVVVEGYVAPNDGATVTAQQGSQQVPLQYYGNCDEVLYFPYNPSLTGPWTITAEVNGQTCSMSTNAIAGVLQMPLVKNLNVSGNPNALTVSWELPVTTVPRTQILVRVYDMTTGWRLFRSESLDKDATSYVLPEGILTAGKDYFIRVDLIDTSPGYYVNRSRTYLPLKLSPPEPPAPTPSVSPLGLVILTGLLGLVGVGMRRRRV